MNTKLIRITDIPALKEAGIPYNNVDAVRWAYRTRVKTGLSEAFVKIGRNCYLDPDKFHACARSPERPIAAKFPPVSSLNKGLPRHDAVLKAIRFHSGQILELLDSLKRSGEGA